MTRDLTGGGLDISLHPVNELVAMGEMLEACGTGVVDVLMGSATFYSGIDPGFSSMSVLPGIWDGKFGGEQALLYLYEYGGIELCQKYYAQHNVRYVTPNVGGAESMMSKKPIGTLEDFEGLTLRTAAGMLHELFKKLGSSPVSLPGSEVYSALQSGLIDTTELVSIQGNWNFGLHEVTDYILYPGFHTTVWIGDWDVNMDVWNKLPKEYQNAF
jgi:TRAP-type mannitol/chloroaromatic compound transport system substrate-binding protein